MHHVIRRSEAVSIKTISNYRSYGRDFEWRAHRGPLPPKEQPTVTTEDGTRTLRVRPQHGGKQSTLPLPPLMDPIAVAAKQKHRTAKPEGGQHTGLNDFRRALATNPFAQALATPIRTCAFTRARLPMHFLLPFAATYIVEDGHVKGYIGSDQDLTSLKEHEAEGYSAGSVSARSYTIASGEIVRALAKKRKGKWNWQFLVNARMQDAYETRMRALSAPKSSRIKVKDKWSWTSSEEQMKSMLINEVVEAFKKYTKKQPDCRHLVPSSKLETVPYCITSNPQEEMLWTADAATDILQSSESLTEEDVLVPAYNLSQIGLAEKLTGLPFDIDPTSSFLVAILQNLRTLHLHLALQKLTSFLGEDAHQQWVVVGRPDWEKLGLTGHLIFPPLPRQKFEPVVVTDGSPSISEV